MNKEMFRVPPAKAGSWFCSTPTPLDDICNTLNINAVLANGKYFSRSELDELLAQVKAKRTKISDFYFAKN